MSNDISRILVSLSLVAAAPLVAMGCGTTRTLEQRSDDDVIGMRVGRRLTADPDVRRYQIDVDVIDGVVTLRGKVESQTIADRAIGLAEGTEGVLRVEDRLMIEGDDDDDERTDLGIKASVGTRLLAERDVRRVNIDVDVIDGVVYLSGVVNDQLAKDTAQRIASGVEGVQRVENELQVSGAEDSRGKESAMEDGTELESAAALDEDDHDDEDDHHDGKHDHDDKADDESKEDREAARKRR